MITFLLPFMTWAALITGDVGQKNIEVDWQGQKSKLELAGKGLRVKKVAFIPIKVYDAYFYVSDVGSFDRSSKQVLSSLSKQREVAMILKFRRSVDAEQVAKSFKEAFQSNSISLDTPGIKDFMAVVNAGGEVTEGKTLTIVGRKDETGETVIYENAKGSAATVKGSMGLIQNIMAIWFGKMGESTMDDLKSSLLKSPL